MSGKSSSARYPQNRTDTRIETGMRVDGSISFTGVLRIQGEILGDVSSDTDAQGTIVVGQAGNVTGTLNAPHIVVGGRVSGPVHSSETIEIHPGASLAGDTFYKAIAVHSGGVIEGLLIPSESTDGNRSTQEQPLPLTDAGPARDSHLDRSAMPRMLGWGIALLVVLSAVVLVNRNPPPNVPSAADVALKASSSMNTSSPEQSAAVASGGLPDGSKGAAGDEAPPAPGQDAVTQTAAQATIADSPIMDSGKMVMVQGVNPRKPTDVLSVTSNEPAVLFRKKRDDPLGGMRIDIAKGEKITIAIAKNEMLRVAEGRNIMIFYQGRKVSPKYIEGRAWMNFVPLSSSQTGGNE